MSCETEFRLEDLAGEIHRRARSGDPASYTRLLAEKGMAEIAKKIGEEGVEVALAAQSADRDAIVNECADLIYHMLVMLDQFALGPAEVFAILAAREGKSGLAEKAARAKPGGVADNQIADAAPRRPAGRMEQAAAPNLPLPNRKQKLPGISIAGRIRNLRPR